MSTLPPNLSFWKGNIMYEKKPSSFKTPDLGNLQAVVIDVRTTIYIPRDADAKEAKKRYLSRLGVKKLY